MQIFSVIMTTTGQVTHSVTAKRSDERTTRSDRSRSPIYVSERDHCYYLIMSFSVWQ